MAGRISFTIDYYTENEGFLPEVAARLSDLRMPLENIIKEWTKGNVTKFSKSMGKELTGADIDPDVVWQQVVPTTADRKRKKGLPDWLMVETGALMEQMTDPDGFWKAISMQEAVFGMPMGEEEEMKVRYNWDKRQVLFLSVDDQRMIDHEIKSYLEMGGNYKESLFTKGLEQANVRKQVATMDVDFAETVLPE